VEGGGGGRNEEVGETEWGHDPGAVQINAVRSDKSIFDFSPSVFGSEYLVFFLTTA